MEYINKKFQLFFGTKSGLIEINDELLEKLKKSDKTSFPNETKIFLSNGPFFEINFNDGSNLIIDYIPIKCTLTVNQIKREILLYSFKHLKLILKHFGDDYKNPYFYSNYYKKDILINDPNFEEKDFSYESSIEIKDKKNEVNPEKIKSFFKELKILYDSKDDFTYEFISPNFNIYNHKDIPFQLKDKFNYIYSDKRKTLESEFRAFINNDSEMIYPICGPNNIGKTITALRIQKLHYLQGVRSLYLNLKFYFKEPLKDFDVKINTLIKECFYFVEKEEELIYLYNEIENVNKIEDAIPILYKHLISKNFPKHQFFLIVDQYQLKYDSIQILNLFSGFKIFLLSSVNSPDVKDNLILIYHEKILKRYNAIEEKQLQKIIRYKYYEYLFDFNYYNSIILKNKIYNKIKKAEERELEKEELEKKFIFISTILKQFNYIPKYSFKFISHYNTIYDLPFYEYKNIFLKLKQYESDNNIDRFKINDLLKDKIIIQKTEIENYHNKNLTEEKYIEYLKYIPLKYINYHLNEKGELYFYYSFPLFKQILSGYIEYFKSKENYFNENIPGNQKGIAFEKIVITQLRVFNCLKIDGHLEVKSIISMEFTENFQKLDKEYLKGKNNILITQENDQGKDYDFVIYKPEKHQLILFQAKYQIDHNLINKKQYYIESGKEVLKNFKHFFNDDNVENVYLLYISSEEFNNKRKPSVINLLSKNQINCLFYSVSNRSFSFNFKDKIKDIECTDSFLLLPEIKNYVSQDIDKEKNNSKKNCVSEDEIIFLNKKIRKNYDKDKIYDSLKNFVRTQTIGISLGKLIKIESFSDEQIKMNKRKEYVIIFSLKDDDDSVIDSNKPIGLIYYDKEREINLEITRNQTFEEYEELFKHFSNNCYYGIGEKI